MTMLPQHAALVLTKWRNLRNAEIAANDMHRKGNGKDDEAEAVAVPEGNKEKIADLYRSGLNIRQISWKLPDVKREEIIKVIRELA